MKLFLHIGMAKTGTTSFQRWAADNRDTLLEQGIAYSRSLGWANHKRFYLAALSADRAEGELSALGVEGAGDRKRFRREVADELAAEAAEARARGCSTFVISSEHCHSRLLRQEEVNRAFELVSEHFDEIEIICSLRPQIDVAVSLASTATRMGQSVTAASFDRVTAANLYYDYGALVDRWCGAFGQDAVTILPFRKMPDTVGYLTGRLGMDATALRPAKRENEAVDVRAMAMVNALGFGAADANASPLENLHLDKLTCREKLQPGLDLARAVQERFAEINARLIARREDLSDGDLEPDWARYDKPSNLHLLEGDCVFADQMAELLRVLNGRLLIAELERKAANAEKKLGRGEAETAGRITKAALSQMHLLSRQENAPSVPQQLAARLRKLERKLAP